jgi:hypothetical protein
MDSVGFARAFAHDGSFRFGNAQPVVGARTIERSVAGFFSTIAGLKHRILGIWSGTWEHGPVKSVELEVVYTRADGTVTEPIPATTTLRIEDGRIRDYRIFVDLAPLFRGQEEASLSAAAH